MSTNKHTEKVDVQIPVEYELTGPDLLDLWKFEEDQGNTVKGRMLTIVTWLLALATGILGFTVNELGILDGKSEKAEIAIGLSVLGLGICIYAWFMIDEFGGHMKRHWQSADYMRARIKWLSEIKQKGGPEFKVLGDNELPGICKRVLAIVIVFVVIFVSILVFSVYGLLTRQP